MLRLGVTSAPVGGTVPLPPSLIYRPPSPKWRKHVMARYYSANDKTQPEAKTAEEKSDAVVVEGQNRRFMASRDSSADNDGTS